MHLPLSHHNTLFKLDTAGSLFFLADFIEPVQPDLPHQSVKGIFHSLQCETQLPSVFEEHTGHLLSRRECVHGAAQGARGWASSATETETSPTVGTHLRTGASNPPQFACLSFKTAAQS